MAAVASGVTVRPFAAYRPPAELLGQVASPPYDVIDSDGARAAVEGNEMSFLHVNKPEIDLPPETNPYDEIVYAKGRENLLSFIEKGYLVRDDAPCMYIYSQQIGDHVQFGIVGETSALEYEQNLIKKHEMTRKKKEDDRTRITDVQSANVGPIFLLYRERAALSAIVNQVTSNPPDGECSADDGVTHRVWVIRDEAVIANIQAEFRQVECMYVADGHHRTASAARVAKMRAEAAAANGVEVTGEEDFNFFLSVIFPENQLKIMDYNRVVNDLNGASPADFLENVQASGWNVTQVAESAAAKPQMANEYGMFVGGNWYKMRPSQAMLDSSAGDVIRCLDVSILTECLLAPILAIGDLRKDERIGFVGGINGLDALANKVAQRGEGVAFALYPTSVEQLMNIADAGEIMPPKSTWFEPKLRSGVIVRTF